MTPFIQPGGGFSKIRGGRSHSVRCYPRGVAPPKAERWEVSGKTPEIKLLGGLSEGLWDCQDSQASLSSIQQGNVCSGGVLWSDIGTSVDGHFCWPSWLWCPQSSGQVEWLEGPLGHPSHSKKLPKRHLLLLVGAPESPKIMGLKGIHSPKALKWWAGQSLCPWCGKEEQNEGTIVNHLCTMHYHLGLILSWCWHYFTMSADIMRWQCPHVSP